MNVNDLKKFLEGEEAEAEFYEFSDPTLSVEDSARQLEVDPEKIVKSLVFKDEDGDPLLAIVPGVDRVDVDKLSEIHGTRVRMAKAREVEDVTGYKIGEVPPVLHGLKTFVDSKVTEFDLVVAGGGSTHTLVKLDPQDIVRITDAELADISSRS